MDWTPKTFRLSPTYLLTLVAITVCWNCCAVTQQSVSAESNSAIQEFNFTSIPRGKVVYKSINELPESARALLAHDSENSRTQVTSLGISFKAFLVDDAAIGMIESESQRLRASTTAGTINPLPPYLASSGFASMRLEAMTQEPSGARGSNTRFAYVFSSGGNGYLLKEWDFVADGGSVLRIIESCNTKVNDVPAVFVVLRGTGTEELRQLSWATNERTFDLYSKGSGPTELALRNMLALATSLNPDGISKPALVEPARDYPPPPIPFGSPGPGLDAPPP